MAEKLSTSLNASRRSRVIERVASVSESSRIDYVELLLLLGLLLALLQAGALAWR